MCCASDHIRLHRCNQDSILFHAHSSIDNSILLALIKNQVDDELKVHKGDAKEHPNVATNLCK